MNMSILKHDYAPTLTQIQENMQAKIIHGDLVFVEFVNHDGAHISLWMKNEATSDSIKSIKKNILHVSAHIDKFEGSLFVGTKSTIVVECVTLGDDRNVQHIYLAIFYR